ncbi:type VI secretion system tip protein TssI/VgrG [Alphaproteobacteria bacterium]|nr:type VI secretion system tip protein TssI/VgrG [Alphaproteobacteria bacterium]
MTDFKVVIETSEQIVVDQDALLAFRFYERLSGLEPTLDKSREDLRGPTTEDSSFLSPFNLSSVHHTPPVLGHEATIQPPYYAQVLITPTVLEDKLEIDDLLGCPARLEITDHTGTDTRHVRGIILRALQVKSPYGPQNAIEIQIYPWIWALSLSEKSRVWPNVNSVSVLEKLIEEYQPEFPDNPSVSKPGLSSIPGLRESVIQWQESDFGLLSRLLERDGIYYFFHHDESTTTIMLGDSKSPYAGDYLPNRILTFQPTDGPGGELFDDHISFTTTQVQTVPRSYHVADYNPLLAGTELNYVIPQQAETALRIYDYPGDVAAVSAAPDAASRRYTAVTARKKITISASRCPFVSAGHVITISDENLGNDTVLRVTQAVHELIRDEDGIPYYRNWFEGIDGSSYYAPTQRTPLPAINGTHNAIVISSLDGETVDLDEDSRALVNFRWDQDKIPVRVRLGQPTAGPNYGTSVLPREGQEVLITFVQGNTERPIILTSVNNSDNPKSDNPTQMGNQGITGAKDEDLIPRQNRYSTTIQNTTGNKIYFSDDTDKELVHIQAFKDFILEIGHKTTGTTDTQSTTITDQSNVYTTGYDDVLDQTAVGTDAFITDKADRGAGFIRSYGDLTLYVGKYGEVTSEVGIPGRDNDYYLDAYSTEKDNPLDTDSRGDYNIYVMGGTSTMSLGSYAWVTSPVTGLLTSASFKGHWGAKDSDGEDQEMEANYTSGKSNDIGISDSVSFDVSSTASYGVGFSSKAEISGSYANTLSMDVASSIAPFDMKTGLDKVEVAIPFFSTTSHLGMANSSSVQIGKGTNPEYTMAETSAMVPYTIAIGVLDAIVLLWSVCIAGIALTKLHGTTNSDNLREEVEDWIIHDFTRSAQGLQIMQGILYALSLILGIKYLSSTAAATNDAPSVIDNFMTETTTRFNDVKTVQKTGILDVNKSMSELESRLSKMIAAVTVQKEVPATVNLPEGPTEPAVELVTEAVETVQEVQRTIWNLYGCLG